MPIATSINQQRATVFLNNEIMNALGWLKCRTHLFPFAKIKYLSKTFIRKVVITPTLLTPIKNRYNNIFLGELMTWWTAISLEMGHRDNNEPPSSSLYLIWVIASSQTLVLVLFSNHNRVYSKRSEQDKTFLTRTRTRRRISHISPGNSQLIIPLRKKNIPIWVLREINNIPRSGSKIRNQFQSQGYN